MKQFFNIPDDDNDIEKESIEYWVKDLQNSEALLGIIQTAAFRRLFDISFLGAIDYSERNYLSNIDRNRASHSLYVAGIANYIATERKYSQELKEHIVAAALLHDIGHIPLSHSAEPYIQKHFGYGHHEIGENIINGSAWKDSGLKEFLAKNFDINFIVSLLNFETNFEGADIFNSKINADTIDGIIRCVEYKGINKSNVLNRISIAKAAFIDTACISKTKRLQTLDDFWRTKQFVYKNFINTRHGILSDKASQIFFIEYNKIEHKDLFAEEKSWRGKYSILFKWLSALKNNDMPSCIKSHNLEYTTRKYEVVLHEQNINKRYINSKHKTKIDKDELNIYREVNF